MEECLNRDSWDDLGGHKARPYEMNGDTYWVAIVLRSLCGVKDARLSESGVRRNASE